MAPIDKDIRMNVYINGTQASNTLKGLKGDIRKMENELRNLPVRSEEYNKKLDELKKKKAVYGELRKDINATGNSINKLNQGFKKYFGILTAGVAALSGTIFSIRELIRGNSELSDSMADVRKTTGMSLAEVKNLYRELGRLNTRTSRSELLKLAAVAGKLGYILEEQVLGFVRAADQINVALAEDLGGNIEEVINKIGKLTGLFKIKEKFGIEDAMLKTGSALNALGAASEANEGKIVDFTSRLGGIAPQAKISIQDIMGLGATLDQLGQRVETSATAISQLIIKMFQETADYAKIANLDVSVFAETLRTDANEAMIMFLEGLKGNSGGLQELAVKFKDLGLAGSKAVGVIGALSNNIKTLRISQSLANDEFIKGTSLTNEFNVKNKNLAGSLEKIGKWLKKIFINSGITGVLEKIVGTMAEWVSIPLSRTMEEEALKVNVLASRMMEANVTAEERNKLYDHLKAISPDIIAGLDKESIAYDTLRKNLAKYNEQMVNRIIIQKKQEEIDDVNEDLATIRVKRLQHEAEVRKLLLDVIKDEKKYIDIDHDPGRVSEMERILNNQELTLMEKAEDIDKLSKRHTVFLSTAMKGLIVYSAKETKALEKTNSLLSERDQLMQELGITIEEIDDSDNQPGGVPTSSFITPPDPNTLKKAKEYMADLQTDLENTRIKIIRDARERELKLEELTFRRKLEQIKGFSDQENQLREVLTIEHNQKISDINTKYDKLEAEKRGIVKVKLEDDIHRKIQQNLDQRHQDEWDAEKMFLERTGQMTTDKRREILEQERDMELAAVADNTEKQLLIWEAYYNRLEEIERERFNEIKSHLQGALSLFGKLYGAYVTSENSKDEIRLRQYEENIDRRKEILQKSLDDGVITYAQYNDEIKNLDKKLSAERARIAKEQAEREYDYAVTMVLLQEAIAIASAIALATTSSKHWVEAIIAIIAAVATVVAEISIASSKLNEARSYSQFARGKYDVIGADDGRTYRDIPYTGGAKTGIYQRPALIAEAGPELIVDAPTTRNIQVNYPWIMEAINYARVPQFASGKLPEQAGQGGFTGQIQMDNRYIEALERFNANVESGIRAIVVYDDLVVADDKVARIENDVRKPS